MLLLLLSIFIQYDLLHCDDEKANGKDDFMDYSITEFWWNSTPEVDQTDRITPQYSFLPTPIGHGELTGILDPDAIVYPPVIPTTAVEEFYPFPNMTRPSYPLQIDEYTVVPTKPSPLPEPWHIQYPGLTPPPNFPSDYRYPTILPYTSQSPYIPSPTGPTPKGPSFTLPEVNSPSPSTTFPTPEPLTVDPIDAYVNKWIQEISSYAAADTGTLTNVVPTLGQVFNYDYKNESGIEPKPIAVSEFPWEFIYHADDWVFTSIYWKNKSPNVTATIVTFETEFETLAAMNDTARTGPRKGHEYYYFDCNGLCKSTAIKIRLKMYTSNMLCSSLLVAEGRDAASILNETQMKVFQYSNICAKLGCVLVVDLMNKCDDYLTEKPQTEAMTTTAKSTSQQSTHSQNDVLTYVIPTVLLMCVITLVIYLSVKKYLHRNSDPLEAVELNTYATTNEVVYADLDFVYEDSQPPRRDEESPYVEIIGVKKPVGGNSKK